MFRFLAAYLFIFAGLFVAALVAEPAFLEAGRETWGWLAAVVVGVPTLCCWAVLEVVDRFVPRRGFDVRRSGRTVPLLVGGVVAAVVTVVLSTPLLVWVTDFSDGVLMGLASIAGTASVVLAMGKRRRGECVHCGYELGAEQRRCPECGKMHSKG